MITTQFLRLVRNRLADNPARTDQRTWSDREILDNAHMMLCSMFRDLADVNQFYGTTRVTLPASLATQRYANAWEYRLPSWCYSILRARESKASTEQDALGVESVRSDVSDSDGFPTWKPSGNSSLLWFDSAARDLAVDVAKRPARLLRGTCDVAGTATTLHLQLDASLTDVDHELEVDAYKGEQVMVTGRASGTGSLAIVGQVRVVESSSRVDLSGFRTLLTFRSADPFGASIEVGHTYETVLSINETFQQFLVLRTIEECSAKNNNVAGIESIRGQLRYEWAKWEQHLRTRDRSGPSHFGDPSSTFRRYDPDRDPLFAE